jgi:Protein of unknown function (DUF1638)
MIAAAPRTLVIACGALAREFLILKRLNGWDHLSITCLPASLHNRPERIPEAVRAKIRQERDAYERVLCLYGDCGTGGLLDAVLAEEAVERIEGAHCYEFFLGGDDFAALAEEEPATFFLTDYLVRHFDTLMIKGLGLDRFPELLETYFGNYRQVVFLSQVPNDALAAKAERAAERLGLPLIVRPTGLGGLERFLSAPIH